MEIIRIDLNNPNENDIKKAAEKIKYGGIVVYPSDTSYGLAVNPKDATALKKLHQLKQSDPHKPVSVNVRDYKMASQYCQFNNYTRKIFDQYLPGPVTLILPVKLPRVLPGDNPGIRIPGTPTTNLLSEFLNIPYTATSANLAGQPESYTRENILNYFSTSTIGPDLFLDAGALPPNPPSTVVDLTVTPAKILRQGPVVIEL